MNVAPRMVIPAAAETPRETATTRFPKLSCAQRLLQRAADAAIMRQVVREMHLKPGVVIEASQPERLSFDAYGRRS